MILQGFWRNKSSEIERPGSFSSHLSKCVNILMKILKINLDYKFLLEIIFHLQRIPDADKYVSYFHKWQTKIDQKIKMIHQI